FLQRAVVEFKTLAARYDVPQEVEAAPSVQIIVECMVRELHEGACLRQTLECCGRSAAELRQHDPPWAGFVRSPANAFDRCAHVGDRSLGGIVYRRREYRLGGEASDDSDRLVLQTDGTRQWHHAAVRKVDKRELVREQPPATAHQPGAQRALAG